jgi:hypothetical protein
VGAGCDTSIECDGDGDGTADVLTDDLDGLGAGALGDRSVAEDPLQPPAATATRASPAQIRAG